MDWKWRSLLVLAFAFAASVLAAQPSRAQEPDWGSVAGTYPQPGTLPSQEELAVLHWLQLTRTRADVARAEVESKPDLDLFLTAIGSQAGADAYPSTRALLKQAKQDMKPMVHTLKERFTRPRPYKVDPTLTPALPDDGSFAFPSKHATEGALFAALLAQLDPADQVSLTEEGGLIGSDRVMAGVHWPSDAQAGQRLGRAFATYWSSLPENGQMIQNATAEWTGRLTRP